MAARGWPSKGKVPPVTVTGGSIGSIDTVAGFAGKVDDAGLGPGRKGYVERAFVGDVEGRKGFAIDAGDRYRGGMRLAVVREVAADHGHGGVGPHSRAFRHFEIEEGNPGAA